MLIVPQKTQSVSPINKPAPYIGGKNRLARILVERINAIEHTAYAEPFVGMGGVFFKRTQVPKCELINDLNGEITNFFRILQRHHGPFMDMLRFQLSSRSEFTRYKETEPAHLTDLERAVRFFYLQKCVYGGKVTGQAFGVSATQTTRFNLTRVTRTLERVHDRLARVTIECLPYDAFIDRYDRPGTLFYLDPPYWGSENDYGDGLFDNANYQKLADQLAGIDGQFILSLNDTIEIRSIFNHFSVQEVSVSYSIAADRTRHNRELIISGP